MNPARTPDPVPALAQAWAAVEPLERWIDAAPAGSRPVAELVRDYLAAANPYPDGTRVHVVVERDPDELWRPGVIAQRTAVDEWSVDSIDGTWIGFRDHTEIRP